jgi:hypothetical protein
MTLCFILCLIVGLGWSLRPTPSPMQTFGVTVDACMEHSGWPETGQSVVFDQFISSSARFVDEILLLHRPGKSPAMQ